jgi:xylan 1,4-beta-xylosidase
LQRVEWVDGWPRVSGGVPAVEVCAPDLPAHPWPTDGEELAGPGFGAQWSTLRRPATPDWLTVNGCLRVHGGQSPYGARTPSLVARPVTAAHCALEATVRFRPATGHQAAGVTAYYNSRTWVFLSVTTDGLVLVTSDRGARRIHPLESVVPDRIRLRVEFAGPVLRFAADLGQGWRPVPVEPDATVLSDEHADEIIDGQVRAFGFTGAMIGLWVQDTAGEGTFADFDAVTYRATVPQPLTVP